MNVKKALTAAITLGALALTLTACGHKPKVETETELSPAEIMNQPEKSIWYYATDHHNVYPTTESDINDIIIAKDGKMTVYDTSVKSKANPDGGSHLKLKEIANKSDSDVEKLAKKYPHSERKPNFKLVMDGSGNNVKAELLNNIQDDEGTINHDSYTSMNTVQQYTMNGQKVLKANFAGLMRTTTSRGCDLLITKLPKATQQIVFDKPGTKNTEKYEK